MTLLATLNPIHAVMGGIFALLTTASATLLVLRRRLAKGEVSASLNNLGARVRSWWVMALLFAFALLTHPLVSVTFLGLISFLALKEYLSLIPTRRADRRVLFWAYLTIPVQFYWAYIGYYGMFIIFIPVYAYLMLPMRMVLIGETRDFLRAAGTLNWGLMICVFSLSHVAFLLGLPAAADAPVGGAGMVLFLVLLTQLNDVSQYLWGKTLGDRKVLPTVSPNKTWAGLLGGIASTVALALLLHAWLTPFAWWQALAAGLLISVGGFLGDVLISAIKRDLKVKDSGSMLPGHGGILDRVDSLSFTAPLFFHFTYYLFY